MKPTTMDIDAMRDLAADIASLLAIADRLAPALEAYADSRHSVGASPAAAAVEMAAQSPP